MRHWWSCRKTVPRLNLSESQRGTESEVISIKGELISEVTLADVADVSMRDPGDLSVGAQSMQIDDNTESAQIPERTTRIGQRVVTTSEL